MLRENIAKLASDRFKVLSCTWNGLNDSLGGLLYLTKFFETNSLDFSNIHVSHLVYKDLDNYFNFKEIKYVKEPIVENYDFVARLNNGTLTRAFSTEYINKFIEIKENFINESNTFKDHVGIQLRHYKSEFLRSTDPNRDRVFTEEVQEYSQRFLSRYSANENYLVVSDNPIWANFFKDKPNISYLVVPEPMIAPFEPIRERYLGFSVNQICALAACKKVYTTNGSFHDLTRLINDKIPKEKL